MLDQPVKMTNGIMDLQRIHFLAHCKIAPNAVNEMWVKTGRHEQESNVYHFSCHSSCCWSCSVVCECFFISIECAVNPAWNLEGTLPQTLIMWTPYCLSADPALAVAEAGPRLGPTLVWIPGIAFPGRCRFQLQQMLKRFRQRSGAWATKSLPAARSGFKPAVCHPSSSLNRPQQRVDACAAIAMLVAGSRLPFASLNAKTLRSGPTQCLVGWSPNKTLRKVANGSLEASTRQCVGPLRRVQRFEYKFEGWQTAFLNPQQQTV